MKFRPCIDLHSGQVKQIVGSTLTDDDSPTNSASNKKEDDTLATNFETDRPASSYAELYRRDGLTGGHVIMLGPGNDAAAKSALAAYPGGIQVGGGINASNARAWLDAGASHVIVTSFVFRDGRIDYDRLSELVAITGKDRLVLDLSCRRRKKAPAPPPPNGGTDDGTTTAAADDSSDGPYYVVTDRWQTYTDVPVDADTLRHLSRYCDEFLVHGVENEGKRCGILEDLVVLLGKHCPIPVTYAGGVRDISDLEKVNLLGGGRVDLTIGSALDCFGGSIPYDDVVAWHRGENE